MLKTLAIIALATSLGACTITARQCPTGQTAVSLADGVLIYEPVMGACPHYPSLSPSGGSSLSDGPMPAPAPGDEWWNLFR